jgi:hypothetical protein
MEMRIIQKALVIGERKGIMFDAADPGAKAVNKHDPQWHQKEQK